jgi:hypothetical protein
MGHLTREALARLVDSSPVSEEQEHLDSCPLCAAELVALREQTESLGSLPDLRPPSGDWEALEARLVSEGLVHDGLKAGRWLQSMSPAWMQLAAALVLFFFGVGLGTRWTGTPENPDIPVVTDAGTQSLAIPVSQITDLDVAADAVRAAEGRYIETILRYRQLLDASGQTQDFSDPASRMEALEALMAAGQAAVRQAPADPFFNGILVSTLAEREAALQSASFASSGNWF